MNTPLSFASTTPRFGLPNLFPGQGQKEFFVNEAYAIIDGLMHLAVEGSQSSPPATPVDGEAWIVGSLADGDWSGNDGAIAIQTQGGWSFLTPTIGMLAYDKSLGQFARYDGTWQVAAEPMEPQGGTTIDVEARATIGQLISALQSFGILSAP